MPSNPSDIARLGHRFQVQFENSVSLESLVASRVQRFEPAIQTNMEVYNELGSVDPTGYASDAPEFRIGVEENVHGAALDLLLAGKDVSVDTAWNARDYINNGSITAYLLERDNLDAIAGELQFDGCQLIDASWAWRMGQPITASYNLLGRLGKRLKAASVVHSAWGVQDTTSPGGIKIKDARLFLGGSAAGSRIYRLQGFNLRVQYRSTTVQEAGNRTVVGTLLESPQTSLDIELAVADAQPDDLFFTFTSSTHYDYTNPVLLTNSAIRVYDPSAAEGATVVRAFKIENLIPGNSTPVLAQVRGLATKRYSLLVPKATTANSGGLLLYKGDIA